MVGKKTRRLEDLLIFGIFAAMPFGQLPGIFIAELAGSGFRIHLLDLLVLGLFALRPAVFGKGNGLRLNNFGSFVLFCMFSWVLSLATLGPGKVGLGFLYLLRLAGYWNLTLVFWEEARSKGRKELFVNSLTAGGVALAALGWVQYIAFADLRGLKALGWDDHYYRLVSTLLDPAFCGIMIVLTSILLLKNYLRTRKKSVYLLIVFLIVSLAFTYSRSSYLAMLAALAAVAMRKESRKAAVGIMALMAVVILTLPRPGGVGVRLERTHSIRLKEENYTQSLVIIGKSPLFGAGYNNLCLVKKELFGAEAVGINSCSGLDNSFLFVAATTGLVGLAVFLWSLNKVYEESAGGFYGDVFRLSALAVGLHSMFTNTLFYPWVMAWMAVLMGVSRTSKAKID
jgi:hypothetical protein